MNNLLNYNAKKEIIFRKLKKTLLKDGTIDEVRFGSEFDFFGLKELSGNTSKLSVDHSFHQRSASKQRATHLN